MAITWWHNGTMSLHLAQGSAHVRLNSRDLGFEASKAEVQAIFPTGGVGGQLNRLLEVFQVSASSCLYTTMSCRYVCTALPQSLGMGVCR